MSTDGQDAEIVQKKVMKNQEEREGGMVSEREKRIKIGNATTQRRKHRRDSP